MGNTIWLPMHLRNFGCNKIVRVGLGINVMQYNCNLSGSRVSDSECGCWHKKSNNIKNECTITVSRNIVSN